MAEIYTKSAEKTLILEPREYMIRPFDFGAWTELRIGAYFGGVASSGNNTQGLAETVTISTYQDIIAWGIKDVSAVLPGFAGSLFLGVMSENGSGHSSTGGNGANSSTFHTSLAVDGSSGRNLVAGGFHDTVKVNGVYPADTTNDLNYPAPTGATGYAAFAAIKFVITHLGAATQSVAISASQTSPITGVNYSLSALRTAINNATYGTARNVAWNDGAAARAIPTCWFLRLPFYSNRIRLSAIDMIKIA